MWANHHRKAISLYKNESKNEALPGQNCWWWGAGILVWSEGLWPISLQFDHPPECYRLNPVKLWKMFFNSKDYCQLDIILTLLFKYHKLFKNFTGHSIIWLAPSSTIFIVRYSVQQEVQYRCPHSKPAIILKKK